MLTGQTETLQSFSFDGPLAAWQGIVLGCVLAALGFWTLFGAGRNTRRKLGSVLFALRVIAIVVLVWLLLGPVRATTTRHFTPKSLAVVTDVSQSMNVVDPPDKLLDLRWETQSAAGSNVDLLSTCDRTVARPPLRATSWAGCCERATGRAAISRCVHPCKRQGVPQRRPSASPRRVVANSRSSRRRWVLNLSRAARRSWPHSLVRVSTRSDSLAPRDSFNPAPLDRDALDRLEKSHRQLVQSVRAIGQLADRVAHRRCGKQRRIASATRRRNPNAS